MSSLAPRALTDLPLLVQEKIIRYCSYAELSRVRCLSKHFHHLCSEQLNRGYYQLETIIHGLQKQIKTKLPRRESERHKHPLSAKFDIVSSLESRIQWLKLTFGSSIQNSLCCFYPGRLLDEIYAVLNLLRSQQTCPNARALLQETRDMSSMAIEHFREQIEPKLQQSRLTSLATIRHNLSSLSCINQHPTSSLKRSPNSLLRRQVHFLNNRIYKQNLVIKSQKYQMRHCKQLLRMRSKALNEHHRRLKSLEKKSKESEQSLVQIRNDNVTLLHRFDQFALLYDQPCSQPVEDNCERE